MITSPGSAAGGISPDPTAATRSGLVCETRSASRCRKCGLLSTAAASAGPPRRIRLAAVNRAIGRSDAGTLRPHAADHLSCDLDHLTARVVDQNDRGVGRHGLDRNRGGARAPHRKRRCPALPSRSWLVLVPQRSWRRLRNGASSSPSTNSTSRCARPRSSSSTSRRPVAEPGTTRSPRSAPSGFAAVCSKVSSDLSRAGVRSARSSRPHWDHQRHGGRSPVARRRPSGVPRVRPRRRAVAHNAPFDVGFLRGGHRNRVRLVTRL